MDLLTIFQILYKRRLLLIIAPFLSAVLAIVFTSDYQKLYKSTAQMATGFTISQEVKITEERFNLYESDVKFNNLIETLSSPRVLSLLSYRLLIHDLTPSNIPFREIDNTVIEEYPSLSKTNPAKVRELLLGKLDSIKTLVPFDEDEQTAIDYLRAYNYDVQSLKEVIQVSRVNRTDYVSAVAITEKPYLSAFIVNVLCEEFSRYNLSITNSRSDESVRVFSQLVSQKREELNKKAEELRKFKSSNRLLNFSAETESKISQISELELNLEEEKRKLRSVLLNLNDIDKRIAKKEMDNKNSTNAEIVSLRKRVSTLNERYIKTGSNNEKLRATIEKMRSDLRNLVSQVEQGYNVQEGLDDLLERKNELEIQKKLTQQNLSATQNNLNQLVRNAGGYATQEAQISLLERELELASEEYKNAQEKYNQALDIALASESSIRQILIGQPASDPEPSKRLIITSLAWASTFSFCIVLIVFIEYFDTSLKSSSKFSSNVSLKLIGSLNHLKISDVSLSELFIKPRAVLKKDSNFYRESLRKLRFELEKLPIRTILVTSTRSGVGKSTLIDSLATALSLNASKVIIIDTNFSNNYLTNRYQAAPILEDILLNKHVDISKLISKTKIPNVDVIGCKGGNYSPSEIFKAGRFSCLLKSLQQRYDFIFLEGAALNNYSDSQELSADVEGVITVFSAKSSLKQADKESILFIKSLKEKNLGAILNNIEIDDMEV